MKLKEGAKPIQPKTGRTKETSRGKPAEPASKKKTSAPLWESREQKMTLLGLRENAVVNLTTFVRKLREQFAGDPSGAGASMPATADAGSPPGMTMPTLTDEALDSLMDRVKQLKSAGGAKNLQALAKDLKGDFEQLLDELASGEGVNEPLVKDIKDDLGDLADQHAGDQAGDGTQDVGPPVEKPVVPEAEGDNDDAAAGVGKPSEDSWDAEGEGEAAPLGMGDNDGQEEIPGGDEMGDASSDDEMELGDEELGDEELGDEELGDEELGDEEKPQTTTETVPQRMGFTCQQCEAENMVIPPKGLSLVRSAESQRSKESVAIMQLKTRLERKEARFVEANRTHEKQHQTLLREHIAVKAELEGYKRLDKATRMIKEAGVPFSILSAADLLAFEPDQWEPQIKTAQRMFRYEKQLNESGGGGPRGGTGPVKETGEPGAVAVKAFKESLAAQTAR